VNELQRQLDSASDEGATKLLTFWGFSDLTLGRVFYDNSAAAGKVESTSNLSFFSSGLDLYAKSQMTRTLSAFLEVRLTYTPSGFTDTYPSIAKIGSTVVNTTPGVAPANTTVQDSSSIEQYQLDGLTIQRAYLEWKPRDWFAIRAGQFLTPFGIWNEDHGSPVLLGIGAPQFMQSNLVPLWQLGLEAVGTVRLGDDFHMEYALSVANSDGPSSDYRDFNDMKAIGGRLKFIYNPDPFYLRLGGFGYYSHYEAAQEVIVAHVTPAGTLDPAYNPSLGSTTQINEAYDLYIFTLEAEARYRRLRVFAEYARQTVIYTNPFPLDPTDAILKGVPMALTAYDPSHYGYGGYVMAAYEIPFHTSLADMTLTPYVGYDAVLPSTTVSTYGFVEYRGGLNFKPSPFITVKVEGARVYTTASQLASNCWSAFTQLAFSF
jgi:hypothetical protein